MMQQDISSIPSSWAEYSAISQQRLQYLPRLGRERFDEFDSSQLDTHTVVFDDATQAFYTFNKETCSLPLSGAQADRASMLEQAFFRQAATQAALQKKCHDWLGALGYGQPVNCVSLTFQDEKISQRYGIKKLTFEHVLITSKIKGNTLAEILFDSQISDAKRSDIKEDMLYRRLTDGLILRDIDRRNNLNYIADLDRDGPPLFTGLDYEYAGQATHDHVVKQIGLWQGIALSDIDWRRVGGHLESVAQLAENSQDLSLTKKELIARIDDARAYVGCQLV